jgi:hypothetical protein
MRASHVTLALVIARRQVQHRENLRRIAAAARAQARGGAVLRQA